MSKIVHQTNWYGRLSGLLPGQFKEQTNWLKLFNALAGTGKSMQLLEDSAFALWQQRASLTNATSGRLDQWGEVVGLPRQGWTDDSYRARILVWLQVLRSQGTPEQLIRIVKDMTGSADVRYWETPVASFSFQYTGDLYSSDPVLALDVAVYVDKARPSGVGIGQVISLPTVPFLFGAVGANGFSETGTERGLLGTDTATEAGI